MPPSVLPLLPSLMLVACLLDSVAISACALLLLLGKITIWYPLVVKSIKNTSCFRKLEKLALMIIGDCDVVATSGLDGGGLWSPMPYRCDWLSVKFYCS